MNSSLVRLAPCLLLCLSVLAFGCGKKSWPTPHENREAFNFTTISVSWEGPCLEMDTVLTGRIENIVEFQLEVAYVEKEGYCPNCPFLPDAVYTMKPTDAEVSFQGSRLNLQLCELEAARPLAVRLVGVNRYPAMPRTTSPIMQVNP